MELYDLWFGHDVFIREVKIVGSLENISPLRVGAGRTPFLSSTVDLPVLKVNIRGEDVPIVPGSSIKGVFRSYAVKLARRKGLNVCQGIPQNTCMDYKISLSGTLFERVESLLKENKDMEARELVKEKVCLLCKIFGAPGLYSNINFLDMMPINLVTGERYPFKLGIKTGIAINRRTGAAKRGALYFVEFVEPRSRFFFEVSISNLTNYALGLIAQEILDLDKGLIRVGGFKSRGFGKVKFVDLRIIIDDKWYAEEKVLKAVDSQDKEIKVDGDPGFSKEDAFKLLKKLASFWWEVKLKR